MRINNGMSKIYSVMGTTKITFRTSSVPHLHFASFTSDIELTVDCIALLTRHNCIAVPSLKLINKDLAQLQDAALQQRILKFTQL